MTVALKGTDFAKSFEMTVRSADKTALNEVIAEAGSDEFEAAFDAAKKVAADEDATPAQVADALAAPQKPGGQAEPERQGGCHRAERPEQDECLDDGVRRGRGPAAGRRCRRGAAAPPRRVRGEPPSQDSGMSGWPPLRNRWRPSFPDGMS